MRVPAAEFQQKLKEFNKLIRFASYRYRIPGVLDSEDLYQEGLLILSTMFTKYDFDSSSLDFRKMFKTELWHGLNKIMQKQKQKKRDYRKKANYDYSYHTLASDDEKNAVDSNVAASSPEENATCNEDANEAVDFVMRVRERLDREGQLVLDELMNPREWDDVPEEFRREPWGGVYWREPRNGVPRHIIADMLGIPRIRLKRTVKKVRKVAAEVAEELGMSQLQIAAFKVLEGKKRKKNVEATEDLSGSSVLQRGAVANGDGPGEANPAERMAGFLASVG